MNRKKTMSNPSFSTTMLIDQSAAEAFAAINDECFDVCSSAWLSLLNDNLHNLIASGVGTRGAQ